MLRSHYTPCRTRSTRFTASMTSSSLNRLDTIWRLSGAPLKNSGLSTTQSFVSYYQQTAHVALTGVMIDLVILSKCREVLVEWLSARRP